MKFVLLLSFLFVGNLTGQPSDFSQDALPLSPSPALVLAKSFVLPGWGHASLGNAYSNRAKVHIGSEIVLLLTYFGVDQYVSHQQNNLFVLVQNNANTNIKSRERSYQLAVGRFNSLAEYNDFQERNRNWTAIFPDTPENRWQWNSNDDRLDYLDVRKRADQAEQQLPALLTLMVANRIYSGLHAFIQARKMQAAIPQLSVRSTQLEYGSSGWIVSWNLPF